MLKDVHNFQRLSAPPLERRLKTLGKNDALGWPRTQTPPHRNDAGQALRPSQTIPLRDDASHAFRPSQTTPFRDDASRAFRLSQAIPLRDDECLFEPNGLTRNKTISPLRRDKSFLRFETSQK